MHPKRSRSEGFTLIELLTVIAIIGILAGIILATIPGVLERAKITKMTANMKQLQTILVAYYTDHGTFPPAYGYLDFKAVRYIKRNTPEGAFEQLTLDQLNQLQTNQQQFLDANIHPVHTLPWMMWILQHENLDLYDIFSEGYDTDRDGLISRLEFSPRGRFKDQVYSFNTDEWRTLYNPESPSSFHQTELDTTLLVTQDPRPLIYLPVNKRLFRKVKSEWYKNASNQSNPRPNDTDNFSDVLANMSFPPPNYDAFVLISVGPSDDTFKIVQNFADDIMQRNNYPDAYYYHVLGMATYFLATRDAEEDGRGDGVLDFDFIGRTRSGQGQSRDNNLEGSDSPRGSGPLIFVGDG